MSKIYFLLITVVVFSLCLNGCNNDYEEEITEAPSNFQIYYVDGNKIEASNENIRANIGTVMEKWLALNGLEEQFPLERMSLYNEDLSGITENNTVETKENEYCFAYEEFRFYFLSDFNSFLEKDGNVLYNEALVKTLSEAHYDINQMVVKRNK